MGWGCAFLIAMIPVSMFARGLVLAQLWDWFVVPLGVAAISIPWALGISGIVWFLTDHADTNTDGSKEWVEVVSVAVTKAILGPLMAWGFGWLWHAWM